MGSLVFFDIDNTLIKEQSQRIFANYLYKRGAIPLILYFKVIVWFLAYKLGFASPIKAANIFLKNFSGYTKGYAQEVFRGFFEKEIKPKFYSQGLSLIEEHKRKGDKIVLVSTAIGEIVNLIKDYLNIDFAIFTQLECEKGVYSGRLKGSLLYGPNKLVAIKNFVQENNFNLEGSFCYADHLSDLKILELVDNPIVVNPGRILKRIAIKRKWKICEFRR